MKLQLSLIFQCGNHQQLLPVCLGAMVMQLVMAHWHWTQGLFMKGMDTIWLLINEWPFLIETVSAYYVQKAADVELMQALMRCTLLEGQVQVQEAQKPAKNWQLLLAANVSRLIFGSYHVMQIRDYTTCGFTNNNSNDTCSYKKSLIKYFKTTFVYPI